MKQTIVARLELLESQLSDLETGKESFGDSDPEEIRVLEARIEELTWTVGLFPN